MFNQRAANYVAAARALSASTTVLLAGSVVAGCIAVLHVCALPLVISYDGHEYIEFAEVIGTHRFPEEWQPPIRTPGFPIVLKLAFGILGRQPMAIVAANTLLAGVMVAVIGCIVTRLAGIMAAGISIAFTAVFPLSIAYQHHALTESGTALALTLVTAALLLPARGSTERWGKAVVLGLSLAAGYYLRQSIQFVVPVAALLFLLEGKWGSCRSKPVRIECRSESWWSNGVKTAIVLFLSIGSAHLWEPYAPSGPIRSYMVKQGILRQALIPVEDPLIGDCASAYQAAISEVSRTGAFEVKGLHAVRIGELADPMYARLDPPISTLIELVMRYPGRYLTGVMRTLLLYAGYPSSESTIRTAQYWAFGPGLDSGRNRIDHGLDSLTERTRRDFSHPTSRGLVAVAMWPVTPVFDHVVVPAGFVALIGLGALALIRRRYEWLVVSMVPLAYVVAHALMLASENRYAFPAQPLAIAALVVVGALTARRLGAKHVPRVPNNV